LIKGASDRLILISPFLKLNNRIKEVDEKQLLTDKGESAGGEAKKGRFGPYFIWPESFVPT